MKNFYDVLGVKPYATNSEIKSAYLKKVKEYHPDVYEGDKDFALQKTAEINEAYNTLKDEKLRQEYDLLNGINKEKQQENTAEQEQTQESQNLFKDFGEKIKTFFKGLKEDLSNFAGRNKAKTSTVNNNEKSKHNQKATKQKVKTATKQQEQKKENHQQKEYKQEINNKDQKDTLFNNNNQNVDEKMEVVASEQLEEQKDNIKRKITLWVLIAIVIILILLVIYVF